MSASIKRIKVTYIDTGYTTDHKDHQVGVSLIHLALQIIWILGFRMFASDKVTDKIFSFCFYQRNKLSLSV